MRRSALTLALLATTPAGCLAAAPAVAQAATTTYTVRAGDTLSRIAATYRTSTTALMTWNRLSSPNMIRVGQVLVVAQTAPARPSVYAPGTSVSAATAQQVMVADRTSGVVGSYARYEWRGATAGWVRVGSAPAYFGYGGMKPGSQRVSGDGSTPVGTYRIMETFGVANPGTRMTYRTVTGCSWWSEKPATYNRFVEQCGHNSGERLAAYTTNATKQYAQTAVIGFNWTNPIRSGKGSGNAIFLHYATGRTAGCVGVANRTEMNATVRWLDPAKKPTIVIKA